MQVDFKPFLAFLPLSCQIKELPKPQRGGKSTGSESNISDGEVEREKTEAELRAELVKKEEEILSKSKETSLLLQHSQLKKLAEAKQVLSRRLKQLGLELNLNFWSPGK